MSVKCGNRDTPCGFSAGQLGKEARMCSRKMS
nr:MAG TPA: hypothetical protein [Caudoviricetes sp.]